MRVSTVMWIVCSIGAVALGATLGTVLVGSSKGKTSNMAAASQSMDKVVASVGSAPAKVDPPKIDPAPVAAPKAEPAKPAVKAAKPSPRATPAPAEAAPKKTAETAPKKTSERAAKRSRSRDDD